MGQVIGLAGVRIELGQLEEKPALDPSPVIPSDLSFGYLSAELKSPVKIPIPNTRNEYCSNSVGGWALYDKCL